MSYRLQKQSAESQPWETLSTTKKPVDAVVEYLATVHQDTGYPLYRIQDGGTTHLWTTVEGGRGSSRYLDKLVDQILYVVLNAAKRIEDEKSNIVKVTEQVLNDENQAKWENGELGNSEEHAKVSKKPKK